MSIPHRRFLAIVCLVSGSCVALNALGVGDAPAAAKPAAPAVVEPDLPGMPRVVNRRNLYSETAAGKLSPAVAGALERVYVPNRAANSVSVIDPTTLKVIDTFKVGIHPQHVVPSWTC
jgi:YVTN family beta-propeller protein